MSRSSIFDYASSNLISVQNMVGNVLQLTSGKCCVGVSFFPLLFLLLLTQKHWRKRMEFQINCVSICFHKGSI